MQKICDRVSLVFVALLFAATAWIYFGPQPLPTTIPTHFGFDGQPNGWGSTAMLWLLPIEAAVLYALFDYLALGRRPSNLPFVSREELRPRLETISSLRRSVVRLELVLILGIVQIFELGNACGQMHGLPGPLLVVPIVLLLATIALFQLQLNRAARG